ncbi:hypothetical protein Goklo_005860, partial [Gossypium klotzschianum]|nr:hypothetical protein [Gossypium klotzschianum]
DDSTRRLTRAVSETDLRDLVVPKIKTVHKNGGILNGVCVEEEEVEKEEAGFDWWIASSLGVEEECGIGGGGGNICGGGGRGGGDGSDGSDNEWGYWDSNNGKDSTDTYYQKMIQANPGNSLLLSNYARFLKEVRGDLVRAEEYCGRAILANPNDGNLLSIFVLASYARFLWDAEEEDDEEEKAGEKFSNGSDQSFFHGAPPLAAAS